MILSIGVGICFLIGGVMMISMVGGPLCFNVIDLLFAYIPMGYLGAILARGKQSHIVSQSV